MNQAQPESISEFSGTNQAEVQLRLGQQEFAPRTQLRLEQKWRRYFELSVNHQLGSITLLWFLLTSNIVVIALDYSQQELFWMTSIPRAAFYFYLAWTYQRIYHNKSLSWPIGTNSKYSLLAMGIACFCLLMALLPPQLVLAPSQLPYSPSIVLGSMFSLVNFVILPLQIIVETPMNSRPKYGICSSNLLKTNSGILFLIIGLKLALTDFTATGEIWPILSWLIQVLGFGITVIWPFISYLLAKKSKDMGRFQKRYLKYRSHQAISLYSLLFIVLITFCHNPPVLFAVLLPYSCLCFRALQFITQFRYEMVRLKNKMVLSEYTMLLSTVLVNTVSIKIDQKRPQLNYQVDLLTIFERTYPKQLCSMCCRAVPDIIFMSCQHYCLCSACLKKQCLKEYFRCPVCSELTGFDYRVVKFDEKEKFSYQKGGYEIEGYLSPEQYFYKIKSRDQIID